MSHEYQLVWRYQVNEYVSFNFKGTPVIAKVIAVNNRMSAANAALYPIVSRAYLVLIFKKDSPLGPISVPKTVLESGASLGFNAAAVELLYV